MKRILITGQNSYIGNKFEEWVKKGINKYKIDKISLRNDQWKNMDWSQYDSILHVAGIAHNSSNEELRDLYYKVNTELTLEVALKAKKAGVNQFIFLSSIIVFGTKNERIDRFTKPNPDNFYGDSKLKAERKLDQIKDENFKVVIVRPPMIYGKGSKGNFPKLSKLAKKTPVFPDYSNKRSMLYIDNLTELLRLIIDNKSEGYYHPQNEEYIRTTDIVKIIGDINRHPIWITSKFNWVINFTYNIEIVNKVFGNLYYDKKFSNSVLNYTLYNLNESIKLTEGVIINEDSLDY